MLHTPLYSYTCCSYTKDKRAKPGNLLESSVSSKFRKQYVKNGFHVFTGSEGRDVAQVINRWFHRRDAGLSPGHSM